MLLWIWLVHNLCWKLECWLYIFTTTRANRVCKSFSLSLSVYQLNCLRTSKGLSLGELIRLRRIYFSKHFSLQKNTLPWWYVFVTVGRVFCHACTSMTILWQNQDSHTCAVVEVFHDITKIIITEVSTSMTINRASQKCFRQGWPTRGIHRNGTPLSYRVGFWIR